MINLNVFLQSTNLRNTWLQEDRTSLYVRKSQRLIEGSTLRMFDLASVEVEDGYRRQGRVKALIDQLKTLDGFDGIFVECVHNEHLTGYLERVGFKVVPVPYSDVESPNYYWLFPSSTTS